MRSTDTVTINAKKASRFKRIQDDIFFKTREGDLFGPYDSMSKAELAVDVYIALVNLDIELNLIEAA